MILYLTHYLLALLLTAFFLFILIPLAPKVGLIDIPNQRKCHVCPTPLVGGIAIFLSILFSLLILSYFTRYQWPFYILAALGILGLLDDYRDLKASLKLALELVLCSIFILSSGDYIIWADSLSHMNSVLTIIFMVALINSSNMLDGVDGLLGSFTIIALLCLAIISVYENLYQDLVLLSLFIGALMGFLPFNFQFAAKKKSLTFLGDAGSLMLGFILSWFCIMLSHKINIFYLIWFVALPLFDMGRVILVRLWAGHHPMHSDRQHLHHLLLKKYSPHKTVLISLLITLGLSIFGIMGWVYETPRHVMAVNIILVFCIYCYLISSYVKVPQTNTNLDI